MLVNHDTVGNFSHADVLQEKFVQRVILESSEMLPNSCRLLNDPRVECFGGVGGW